MNNAQGTPETFRPERALRGAADCGIVLNVLIVDAQVHIWGSGRRFLRRQTSVFSKDELLKDMDAAGVDTAVIRGADHGPSPLQLAGLAADGMRGAA